MEDTMRLYEIMNFFYTNGVPKLACAYGTVAVKRFEAKPC